MPLFTQGHALIIGAGADLPNTVADAEGFAAILKAPQHCAYPPEQVQVLTEEDATRQHILIALEHLEHHSTSESTVIFYFSGHGYRAGNPATAYYLMPHGYDVAHLAQTALSGTELAVRLRALPARKLLLLLDCCHAGGFTQTPPLPLQKSPLPPEALALLAEGRGRVLIASSQENELSFAGNPYSAFTLALVEALCGVGAAQQDGYVRVADLALHARQVVPERTGDRQHPVLNFEQADNFILAFYAGGETQPKALPFTREPEIEPSPGAWRGFDQHGQIIHGNQLNIAPVIYGAVQGPLVIQEGAQTVRGDHNVVVRMGDVHGGTLNISAPTPATEELSCPHCGATLRPEAKFCPRCGAPVR
ncbi:MAG: caspase family protein [Anaerolineae bacterium]|nr:caspase family protein [Anaerolineae bacterium]